MSAVPAPPATDDARQVGAAIDVAGGVDRLMGDRVLYMRALERFRGDYQGVADAIRAALYGGERPLALRLAHTVKGAAGMIEARILQRRARALEVALHAAPGDCAVELGLMQAELGRVVDEIGQLTRNAAGAPQRTCRVNPGDAIERLRALLDVGDGAATDLIRNERERLVAALGEARCCQVEAAVDVFDFVLALRLLDGAAAAA
jgi:HPt (histidine-containing phosphotransfer) domain-containing protein